MSSAVAGAVLSGASERIIDLDDTSEDEEAAGHVSLVPIFPEILKKMDDLEWSIVHFNAYEQQTNEWF